MYARKGQRDYRRTVKPDTTIKSNKNLPVPDILQIIGNVFRHFLGKILETVGIHSKFPATFQHPVN